VNPMAFDDVTSRYTFNPTVRAETIRRRDELERRNAEARREYMLRNRGMLLAQLIWCVPENDWRKVAL
jgi:hypothetical protein